MSAQRGVKADLADVVGELRSATAKIEEARHAECAIRRALYLLDEARA